MSAHGTNPASAKMAGLNVVYLKTNKNGEVTLDTWKESIDEHKKYLACIMVTYPSTNGIFEDTIRYVLTQCVVNSQTFIAGRCTLSRTEKYAILSTRLVDRCMLMELT